MPDSDAKTVSTVSHFTVELAGAEQALLFNSAQIAPMTLNTTKFMSGDTNGNPIDSVGGGTSVQYGDLQVTRGVDTDHQLYEQFKDVKENGATADNAKELKLTAFDAKGETLFTLNITGAHISSYAIGGFDHNSNAILTESATFTFADMTIE